jgi:hypothetical protein
MVHFERAEKVERVRKIPKLVAQNGQLGAVTRCFMQSSVLSSKSQLPRSYLPIPPYLIEAVTPFRCPPSTRPYRGRD